MLKKCADFIEIKKSNYGHTKYAIVVPTFMRCETLKNTLKSAFAQRYKGDYKVVVVDNNPNREDETELYLKKITDARLSYYKNSINVGMVNNWNQCILAADCDWVLIVHDDDLLTDDCLENVDETISAYPKVDAVLPNFIQKDNPYSQKKNDVNAKKKAKTLRHIFRCFIKKDKPITANLFCDNIYGPPTCGLALKAKEVIEFGGYSDRCIAADWDFMSHFSRTHKIVKCSKQTGVYLWGVNASLKESTMEQMRKDRIAIIKDIVEYSSISKFYYNLLNKDFEKKFAAKTIEHVEYSFLYRIIERFYSLRV